MNFLLTLNRKYILFVSLGIFLFFFIFVFFNYFITNTTIDLKQNIISDVDITEPRFAINNSKQKIFITAKEGNFISESEILLKKNVLFKSNNFIIESDNVIFDRKKQTATSQTKSIFISDKTRIDSEGFNIYDNGKKIKFIGNSVIILK